FVPVVAAPAADVLSSVEWASAPPLLGFVLTAPRDGAEVLLTSASVETEQDGPILARWRYGLGKSAAFTSDASARWSRRWRAWSGFATLFGTLARWLERDPAGTGLRVALRLDGGEGTIEVEADDPTEVLDLEARVDGPAGAPPLPALDLDPIAPGR